MQTVLFHSTIFGPIHSRRLGISLGINLMPNDGKVCSFDCLYCEAGFNAQGYGTTGIPSREMVKRQLKEKLEAMQAEGSGLDVLTFSGNGEPTLHPHFKEVVSDVMMLRDRYYPNAKVSVLSNSTMAGRPQVAEALKKVDNNILKLDSAIASTMRIVNRPQSPNVIPEGVIDDLKQFAGQCIIQTMMLRGQWEGRAFDNTTDDEVQALIEAYKLIQPREIMLYSLDRKTPADQLVKIEHDELQAIGDRIAAATGIQVQVN